MNSSNKILHGDQDSLNALQFFIHISQGWEERFSSISFIHFLSSLLFLLVARYGMWLRNGQMCSDMQQPFEVCQPKKYTGWALASSSCVFGGKLRGNSPSCFDRSWGFYFILFHLGIIYYCWESFCHSSEYCCFQLILYGTSCLVGGQTSSGPSNSFPHTLFAFGFSVRL